MYVWFLFDFGGGNVFTATLTAPAEFRQRAIGQIPTIGGGSVVEFPNRQRTRLRVSITRTAPDGTRRTTYNRLTDLDDGSLDGALKSAQDEVVEQEIFACLIREASNLPTASAEVFQRLIIIEAAQNTELRFELVDGDSLRSTDPSSADPQCDLVYSLLGVLLARAHRLSKIARLSRTGNAPTLAPAPPPAPPPVLQPIIDVLQYREFWERVRDEIDRVVDALRGAGVLTKVHYDPVADGGEVLTRALLADEARPVSGDAILRIDGRCARFPLRVPVDLNTDHWTHVQTHAEVHYGVTVDAHRPLAPSNAAHRIYFTAVTTTRGRNQQPSAQSDMRDWDRAL